MSVLVIFDLETTGVDRSRDQIIQFAGIKVDTETNKIIDSLDLYIQPVGNYTINIGAYLAHHISADFLKDKPYFKDVANQIVEFFDDYDVLTYNGLSFDIPFLNKELDRVGLHIDFMHRKCYDAFLEEKRRNGNTLGETYKRYSGKNMEDAGLDAHNALSDVKATYSVFYAQQKAQPFDPEMMFGEDGAIKMMDFCGTEKPCFALGKYYKVSVEYVAKIDKNYIAWCISDKCNFSNTTKEYIKTFIN